MTYHFLIDENSDFYIQPHMSDISIVVDTHKSCHIIHTIDTTDGQVVHQTLTIELKELTMCSYQLIASGAGTINLNIQWKLTQRHASAKLGAVYALTGSGSLRINSLQEHQAEYTTSFFRLNGIVADQASAYYEGRVKILPQAPYCIAGLTNKNILLSTKARAETKPILEVENFNVKCAHGAAVGPVDQEAMWYMQARGLAMDDAKQLLLAGFLSDCLLFASDDEKTEITNKLLHARFLRQAQDERLRMIDNKPARGEPVEPFERPE